MGCLYVPCAQQHRLWAVTNRCTPNKSSRTTTCSYASFCFLSRCDAKSDPSLWACSPPAEAQSPQNCACIKELTKARKCAAGWDTRLLFPQPGSPLAAAYLSHPRTPPANIVDYPRSRRPRPCLARAALLRPARVWQCCMGPCNRQPVLDRAGMGTTCKLGSCSLFMYGGLLSTPDSCPCHSWSWLYQLPPNTCNGQQG